MGVTMKNPLRKLLNILMYNLGYEPSRVKMPIEIFLQQIEGRYVDEYFVPIEICSSIKVHACVKKSEESWKMIKEHLAHDMAMHIQKHATYDSREIRSVDDLQLGRAYTEHSARIKILVKK